MPYLRSTLLWIDTCWNRAAAYLSVLETSLPTGMLGIVATAFFGVAGILASIFISRAYYLKSIEVQGIARSTLWLAKSARAIRKAPQDSEANNQLTTPKSELGQSLRAPEHQPHSGDSSLGDSNVEIKDIDSKIAKIALAIIDAMNRNEIYFPEYAMAVRSLGKIAALMSRPIESASKAATPFMTLSPRWQEARHNAFTEEMNRTREELQQAARAKGRDR